MGEYHRHLKSDNHFTEEKARESDWLVIAKRVLAGEFMTADRSTVQSIIIGLRSNPHPDAKKAVATLETQTHP